MYTRHSMSAVISHSNISNESNPNSTIINNAISTSKQPTSLPQKVALSSSAASLPSTATHFKSIPSNLHFAHRVARRSNTSPSPVSNPTLSRRLTASKAATRINSNSINTARNSSNTSKSRRDHSTIMTSTRRNPPRTASLARSTLRNSNNTNLNRPSNTNNNNNKLSNSLVIDLVDNDNNLFPANMSAGSNTSISSRGSANSSQSSHASNPISATIPTASTSLQKSVNNDRDLSMLDHDDKPAFSSSHSFSSESPVLATRFATTSSTAAQRPPTKATKSFTHSTPFSFNTNVPAEASLNSASSSGNTRALRRSRRLMNLEAASTSSNQPLSSSASDSRRKHHGKSPSSSSMSSHSSYFSHSSSSSRSSMNSDISTFSSSDNHNSINTDIVSSAFANDSHLSGSTGLQSKKRTHSVGFLADSLPKPIFHSHRPSNSFSASKKTPFYKQPYFSTESTGSFQSSPSTSSCQSGLNSTPTYSGPTSSSTPLHNSTSSHNLFPSNSSNLSSATSGSSSSPQDGGPLKVRKIDLPNLSQSRNDSHVSLGSSSSSRTNTSSSDTMKPFKLNPSIRPLPPQPNQQQTHPLAFSYSSPSPTPTAPENNRLCDRLRNKLPISPSSSSINTTFQSNPSHSNTFSNFNVSAKPDTDSGSNSSSIPSPNKGGMVNNSSTPNNLSSKLSRPPFRINASLGAEMQYEYSSNSSSESPSHTHNNPSNKSPSDSFKFAKPLQTAFMSTGLMSKRNRRRHCLSDDKLARPPDTPCKKPGMSHVIDHMNINQPNSRGPPKIGNVFGSSSSSTSTLNSRPASSFRNTALGVGCSTLFGSSRKAGSSDQNNTFNNTFTSVSGAISGLGNRSFAGSNNSHKTSTFGNFFGTHEENAANGCVRSLGPKNGDFAAVSNHSNMSANALTNSDDSVIANNNNNNNLFNDSFDVTMEGHSIMMNVPSSFVPGSLDSNHSSSSSIAGDTTLILKNQDLDDMDIDQTNADSAADTSFVHRSSSSSLLMSKGNSSSTSDGNQNQNENSFSTDIADNDMDNSMDLDSTPLSAYSRKKKDTDDQKSTASTKNTNTAFSSSFPTNSNSAAGQNSSGGVGYDFLENSKNGFESTNDDLPSTPTKHRATSNSFNFSNFKKTQRSNFNSFNKFSFENSGNPSFGSFGGFNTNTPLFGSGFGNNSATNLTAKAGSQSAQSSSLFGAVKYTTENSRAAKQTSSTSTITPGKYSAAAERSTTPVSNANNGSVPAYRMTASAATMTPLARYNTNQNSNTNSNANNNSSNNGNGSNAGNTSFGSDNTFSPHTPDVVMKGEDGANYEPLFGASISNTVNGNVSRNNSITRPFKNGYRNFGPSSSSSFGNFPTNGNSRLEDAPFSSNNGHSIFSNTTSPRTPAKSTDLLDSAGEDAGDHLMIGGWANGDNARFNPHSSETRNEGNQNTNEVSDELQTHSNRSSVFNFGNNDNSPGFGFTFSGNKDVSQPFSRGFNTSFNNSGFFNEGNSTLTHSFNNNSHNNANNSNSSITTINRSNSGENSFASGESSGLFGGNSTGITTIGSGLSVSPSGHSASSSFKFGHAISGSSSATNLPKTHSGFSETVGSDIGLKADVKEDALLSARFERVQMAGRGEFSYVYVVTEKPSNNQTVLPNSFAVKRTKNPYASVRQRLRLREEVEALRALTIDYKKCQKGLAADAGDSETNDKLKLATEDDEGRDHIVTLVSDWEQGGFLYIMTEYCENGNLDEFLAKSGDTSRLDEWRVWKILVEISTGLRYIHECGYLHLDIKPANIFITFEGSLKIGDFGMATKYPVPKDSEREGDREYIAPEVLTNHQYGTPADIFSLGLMMIEVAANIYLPDNGVQWQKLRSGDLSDAGRLSSGNLYYSDSDDDDDDEAANDRGAAMSSSDDPGEDEDEELDNDVTDCTRPSFDPGNSMGMASSAGTSGLVSPKFPPCSLALPSGLSSTASRKKKTGFGKGGNTHFNQFATQDIPRSASQPTRFSLKEGISSNAYLQVPTASNGAGNSDPQEQYRFIQQEERARRARNRAYRREQAAAAASSNGNRFLQKQQRQSRLNLSSQKPSNRSSCLSFKDDAAAPHSSSLTMLKPSASSKQASTIIKSATGARKPKLGRRHGPPSWAPKFMTDDSGALDAIVKWMLSPDPASRPTAAALLATNQVRWVEEHRKAGAVIYEGDFGPRPDSCLGGTELSDDGAGSGKERGDVDVNWR